jgi:hypothetical protein
MWATPTAAAYKVQDAAAVVVLGGWPAAYPFYDPIASAARFIRPLQLAERRSHNVRLEYVAASVATRRKVISAIRGHRHLHFQPVTANRAVGIALVSALVCELQALLWSCVPKLRSQRIIITTYMGVITP